MVDVEFRQVFYADWKWRLLDLLAHVSAALVFWLVIPLGSPLWQWLPDVLVPVVWIRSMTSNKFLPESDLVLRGHKALHSLGFLLILAFGTVVFAPSVVVFVNCCTHRLIDFVTHENWGCDANV